MGFEALRGKMDVSLYMLCSCIAFIFLITSTPVSQFRGKGIHASNGASGASKISCVTVWGLKNNCGENNYNYRPTAMECSRPKQLFQAAAAFYIISVVVSCVSCILCGVYFIGLKLKLLLMVLGASEIIFALIPWVCMTAVWYNNYCDGSTATIDATTGQANGIPYGEVLRTAFSPSAGYGLTIAAWCIQVIGVALLFVV